MANIKRIGQVFTVNGAYVPKKASVFLKPNTSSILSYFEVTTTKTIDATNFSDIEYGDNILWPSDVIAGYTGKGYIENKIENIAYTNSKIIFPAKFSSAGTFYLWIRGQVSSGDFDFNVYINDVLFSSSTVASVGWDWYSVEITIPDTNECQIKIESLLDGMLIDKIYITNSGVDIPTSTGSAYSSSPYITIHSQVYDLDVDGKPDNLLYVHDFKTTISEVKTNSWYNFDLNFLSLSESVAFSDEKYALVLFTSGSDDLNYIVWETGTNDEYSYNYSVVKY